MEMLIKIEDYLSYEEIKEIATERITAMFATNSDNERIVSNLAHSCGQSLLKDFLTNEDLQIIREKAKKILLETDLTYYVYSKPDIWNHTPKEDLVVYNVIQATIRENLNTIKERVIESLENINTDKLVEEMDFGNVFTTLIQALQTKDKK